MGKSDMDAMQKKIEEGEAREKKERKAALTKKTKERTGGFFKDFKKFITKGNILDLAVAVVIGTAFNAIVNGLVKFIINPVISLLTGGVSLDGWKTVLTPEEVDEAGKVVTAEVAILWGEWLQTIINFLIIALCIFVAVRAIRRTSDRINRRELEAKQAEEAKKKAEEQAKAEALAAENARKEAELQHFYANVERGVALLEQLSGKK